MCSNVTWRNVISFWVEIVPIYPARPFSLSTYMRTSSHLHVIIIVLQINYVEWKVISFVFSRVFLFNFIVSYYMCTLCCVVCEKLYSKEKKIHFSSLFIFFCVHFIFMTLLKEILSDSRALLQGLCCELLCTYRKISSKASKNLHLFPCSHLEAVLEKLLI